MLNNRMEFFPIDLGVVTLGGVPFSIYQTASPEQIAYVVGDAGAKVAIVEKSFLETFEKARKELPDIEHLIVLDGDGGTMSYEELIATDPDFDDDAPRTPGRARRHPDADLHVGDDRPAEGRRADPPQPPRPRRRRRRPDRLPRRGRQDHLLAARPPTSPSAVPITTCR